MFKESFERGTGEQSAEKTELEKKIDQLMLMRKKKIALEAQKKVPVLESEAERINNEYEDVSELIGLIERDIDTMKEAEKSRLEAKFEEPTGSANDSAFDAALRATGEGYDADRIDARRKAA